MDNMLRSIISRGDPLATLEVKTPPDTAGRTIIIATLKSHGRIVAQGHAQASNYGDARIILLCPDNGGGRTDDDYELWVTLDRDGRESWYPGFSDLFIHLQWPFRDGPWKNIGDSSLWREKRLSKPENLLRIHYHRYGGYDEGVGLWTWNDRSDSSPIEIFEVDRDEFGLIFELDMADYGENAGDLRLGILPRRAGDWNLKEDDNLFWHASLGNEIYLIGTAPYIWKERPDTRQQVLAAFIDTPHRLVVQVSRPVDPGEISAEAVVVTNSLNQRVAIGHISRGDRPSTIVEATTAEPMDVGRHSYSISLENFAGAVTASLRGILDDRHLFFDGESALGAVYSPESTIFRLFAPTANKAHVLIRDGAADAAKPPVSHVMNKAGRGIFEGIVTGDLKGKWYRFSLNGQGTAGEVQLLDPYAVNTVGQSEWARITDLGETNPPDWERLRQGPRLESPVDMIVYEMHVRDFTIAPNSGVSCKGRYLGFAEAGTRLPDDPLIRTGLDHLEELGITHVQLLPVQDFSKDPEDGVYNWGYMTVAFNSPEGWYATSQFDDSRIRELKQLIAALHSRNIGVILDVVYNHTDHSAPFHLISPQYYYRLMPDGKYSNGSGVGNDFRTENPMARRYLVDSLKFWVSEYGVDGFRFDLMALIDFETMQEIERELRAIKPSIVLYGEPWSSGYSPISGRPTDKGAIRQTGMAAFNDHFRNALGGSPNGAESGFIQNGSFREKIVLGLEGSYRDWSSGPCQTINYMTCHDNLVLYDKLRWFSPTVSEQTVLEMMKLGYLLLFTAQGIPFLHGGEEFARTKFGHGNSYDAGDQINQVDWSLKRKNYELFEYVRALIALRRQHPLFRLRTARGIGERMRFHATANEKTLAYSIDGGNLENEIWLEACVLINGEDSSEVEFQLPPGRWLLSFDHAGATERTEELEYRIRVSARSGLILRRKEDIKQPPEPELEVSREPTDDIPADAPIDASANAEVPEKIDPSDKSNAMRETDS